MSATPDRGVWLLVATLEGREYRWATVASTVDGVEYPAGLQDPGGVERGADSIDVSVYDPSIDWPSIALAIDGGEATLYRWTGGTPVAYAGGELQVVGYATRRDPVGLRIDRLPGAESLGRQIPDELAQVTEDTWPPAGAGAGAVVVDTGRYYPVILGYPGYASTSQIVPVVPVPLAQWANAGADTFAVVAEDGEQAVTQVTIRNGTVDAETIETVAAMSDAIGRRVLVADFADTLVRPATSDDAHELYAAFYPSGGGGPRDAYSVLVYLLRRWGGTSIDWDRLPAIADVLSRYSVDTWIDSPMSDPWAWMEGTVFGALPVEARTGPRGRYLVERRYLSDPRRNVGTLVEGVSCTIASSVALSDGPINEFVGRFRPGRDQEWLGQVLLTGRDGLSSVALPSGTVTVRSARCSASVARYGPRQGDPVDLDWTWDEGTMLAVLELAAARDALPARLVSYLVPDGEDLEEADEFTLIDTDRGFDGVAAIVDGPPVASSAGVTVQLRVPS